MPDILTALTSLAVSVFRERAKPNETRDALFSSLFRHDPVLDAAHRESFLPPGQHPAIDETAKLAFSEPDLAVLAPRQDELDPMLMYPGGGMRTSPSALISSLLSSAILQIHFLRLTMDEGTFVRTVLEGFEELRRAARGERIRAYSITGVARIALPEGAQVSTPWGVLRPSPAPKTERPIALFGQPRTTCILAEPRLLPVKFDRAPNPTQFDISDSLPMRYRILFPLSCALASREADKPVVPLLTWSTLLTPFQAGFGYSMPLLPPVFTPEVDVSGMTEDIEEWARIVDRSHTPSVDIAAGRLLSAVANRLDKTDSLVDAVMVWENLVGTSSEVTFRVTAALAKLLESDAGKRRALRKDLAGIYNIRSRVIHGMTVDASDIEKACSAAINVAVCALRACYERGGEWLALSSNERADAILLEWQ